MPRLRTLAGQYPGWTLSGDYVRLAGTMTVGKRENVLTAVEALTSQNWSPTIAGSGSSYTPPELLDKRLPKKSSWPTC